jgi:transcriptional regulator with XRE-family HTH domain
MTNNKNGANNLKDIRISEGYNITELSKLSNVSTKVISETEKGLRNPTDVIKSRILNALNSKYDPVKYLFGDIFPE